MLKDRISGEQVQDVQLDQTKVHQLHFLFLFCLNPLFFSCKHEFCKKKSDRGRGLRVGITIKVRWLKGGGGGDGGIEREYGIAFIFVTTLCSLHSTHHDWGKSELIGRTPKKKKKAVYTYL